jgi:hypothetical protein
MMRRMVIALALLCSTQAVAQLAPNPRGSCPIAVAFEPLAVRSVIGVSNQYHAVVLIGGDAFEANPSGSFPNWGTLVGRQRSLSANPLKDGHLQRPAGYFVQDCASAIRAARTITDRLNAARLPYAPAPELAWNSVNSNSYAHYLVRKLGLAPPAPPWPPAYGFVPGYHAAIQD